jgi:hypothetical protein
VSFSPDGRDVLTSSRDGTAIIWLASDWRNPQPNVAKPFPAGDETGLRTSQTPSAMTEAEAPAAKQAIESLPQFALPTSNQQIAVSVSPLALPS